MPGLRTYVLAVIPLLLVACGGTGQDAAVGDAGGTDAGMDSSVDAGSHDSGPTDAGPTDAGPTDAGPTDAGPTDAGPADAGPTDAGPTDAGPPDARPTDAGPTDAGPNDAGPTDASTSDAGFPDSGPPALLDAGTPAPGLVWSWSESTPGPARSSGFSATWDGTRIVIAGGRVSGGGCAGSGLSYFPWSDRWDDGPENYARHGAAYAVGEFVLFSAGPFCGQPQDSLATSELYDWWTGTIDTFPNLTDRRGLHASHWTGQAQFVFGGDNPGWSAIEPGPFLAAPGDPSWTSGSTVARPFQPADLYSVWTGTEVIIFGGDAARSGRYDPAADQWQPMATPPVALQIWPTGGDAAWTGSEMIIWDGTAGARYDPAQNNWTTMSLVNAPTSPGPLRLRWTGQELLVIGNSDGGHYDPATDTWTRMVSEGAQWLTNDSAIEWTGQELLVFGGGAAPSNTAVHRYGPRLAGNPTCTGGAAPLVGRIRQPSARTVVWGPTTVEAVIDATNTVSVVEWRVDGSAVATGGTSVVDFSTLSPGVHTLTLLLEDSQSNVSCHEQGIVVNAPPTLAVAEPDVDSTASGFVDIAATCATPTAWCSVRTADRAAVGGPRMEDVAGTIDLSDRDGEAVDVVIETHDAYGTRIAETRTVWIESSPRLQHIVHTGGAICDVGFGRALSVHPTGFSIRELSTGTDTVVPMTGAPNCTNSRLIATGAVLKSGSRNTILWNGAAAQTWMTGDLRVAGTFSLSLLGDLILRDLSNGAEQDVTSVARPYDGYALGANGSVFWQTTADALFFQPVGALPTSLGSGSAGNRGVAPVTDGTTTLWRTYNGTWTIHEHNQTTSVLTNYATPQRLEPNRHYAVRDGWVAWVEPDTLGVNQVWLRGPTATPAVVTGFTDSTTILALGPSGHLVYERDNRAVWRQPSPIQHIEFGSDRGDVYFDGTALYVAYRRDLFRVTP